MTAAIAQLLRHATPLFEPQPYRGATDRRRFFEEVELPRNLVVLGDAVATFNPSYGQGMTTAALQAEALQRQLRVRRGVLLVVTQFKPRRDSTHMTLCSRLRRQHAPSARGGKQAMPALQRTADGSLSAVMALLTQCLLLPIGPCRWAGFVAQCR